MAERMLVLGLVVVVVVVRAEVRARDPEVEKESRQSSGHGLEHLVYGARGGPRGHRPATSGVPYPSLGRGYPRSPANDQAMEMAPPSGNDDTQHSVKRIGNWCPYISYRVVTMKVSFGTEKYTIKSQSPCPSGSPDCQLVMYKQAVRPVYKEMPKIVSAQLWKCCPGHGGINCEDTVTHGHVSDGSDETGSDLPASSEVRRRDERQAHSDHFQAHEHFEAGNSTETGLKFNHSNRKHFGHRHDRGHGLDGDHDHDHDHDHHKTGNPLLLLVPFSHFVEKMMSWAVGEV